jgi:hypothetical protein
MSRIHILVVPAEVGSGAVGTPVVDTFEPQQQSIYVISWVSQLATYIIVWDHQEKPVGVVVATFEVGETNGTASSRGDTAPCDVIVGLCVLPRYAEIATLL